MLFALLGLLSTISLQAVRLVSASTGTDPTVFERAVCDVFSALGFVATHLGGNPQPDGILDAALGPLAYRVVLECESTPANATVGLPNVEEPARYRKMYDAQAAASIGPAFGSEPTLISNSARTT